MNALFISSVWLLEKVPVRNLLFILFARSSIHFCSSHAWLPISIQCSGQSRVRVSITSRLGVEEIADGTPTPTNQMDTKNIWVVYKDSRAPVTAGIEHIKYVLQSDAWEIDGIVYGFNEQSPARGGGRPCFHMLIGWALLLCVVSQCTLRLPSFQPVTHRRSIGTGGGSGHITFPLLQHMPKMSQLTDTIGLFRGYSSWFISSSVWAWNESQW